MTSVVDFSSSYSLLTALRDAGFPRERIYRALAALYDPDPADEPDWNDLDWEEPDDDLVDPDRNDKFPRRVDEDDDEDWDDDFDESDDPSHVDGEDPIDPDETGEWCMPEDEPYQPTPEDWHEYELYLERLEYERSLGINAHFV